MTRTSRSRRPRACPPGSRRAPTAPTRARASRGFDFDPPDGGFALAIRVAHLIREELERLELESYVKTSGADG
ncbi:MAG: hypothetical protein ACRDJB_10485, partial [Actinomycetota bacterium]